MPATRARAAQLIARLQYGSGSLPSLLYQAAPPDEHIEQALLWQLCYGTARWFPQLLALRKLLMERPLPKRDREIGALLLVGLYQIQHTRIPQHAAVHATVDACHPLERSGHTRLVNAVLRNYLRRRVTLHERLSPAQHAAMPDWLWDKLQHTSPPIGAQIATNATQQPPMTLRLNPHRLERTALLEQLTAQSRAASPCRYAEYGVQLEKPIPQERIPGFSQGLVSVQDEAAQLAAPLLDVPPGARVLDACAAPGGKSGQLLELYPHMAQLLCLERDAARLEDLRRNLERLQFIPADAATPTNTASAAPDTQAANPVVHIRQADARRWRDWWDGVPFARILLDAPCSGSGVLRRHPDIKILRRATDLSSFTSTQAALLDSLWRCLEPGGMLLYASCSVLPEENEEQIAAFLYRHQDAREQPLTVSWGMARRHGRQLLPHENGADGLYYARLHKTEGGDRHT